jgi:dCMP deaminase
MKFQKTLMETAKLWAKESYCKRRQVGCVIAKDSEIVSQGFNGTVKGAINICEEHEAFDEIPYGETIKCPKCINGETPTTGYSVYRITDKCDYCNGYSVLKYIDKTNPKTLHAETNALMSALRRGISTQNCDIYITLSPCLECSKLIIQSGIKNVFYHELYNDEGVDFLKECGINVSQI